MRLKPLAALLALPLVSSVSAGQCGDYLYKVLTPVPSSQSLFGQSVGLSGGVMVVGESDATGIAPNTGAAYLFDKATGLSIGSLFANDGVAGQLFGESLDIEGNLVVIGARGDSVNGAGSGAAYLFDVSTGAQLFKFVPNDGAAGDNFGSSLAISGSRVLIGTLPGRGAYLFDTATGVQLTKFVSPGPAGDYFGHKVGLSQSRAVVGAPTANDVLPFSGVAHVYDTTSYAHLGVLRPTNPIEYGLFGIALDVHGSVAIAGLGTGLDKSACVFDLVSLTETLVLRPYTPSFEDAFGWSVALTDGRAIVGNSSENWNDSSYEFSSVHLFDTSTGVQLHEYEDGDQVFGDGFGSAVAIDGDSVLVGAAYIYNNTGGNGGAYLFDTADAFSADGYCQVRFNGSGQHAIIQACGSPSISANDFQLTVTSIPNTPYLFFYGMNQIEIPFGQGFLCVSGGVKRLGPAQMASGLTGSVTVNLPQEITTPGTRQFQCWFRETLGGGPAFNLSNALSVTFLP